MAASTGAGAQGSTPWPSSTTPDSVAELVRTLEVTISRRLDGVLHGNHQGLTPGHGSEPGEARLYQPGDDVRRIDWNVTARTRETHVRDLIADRDLEAWLIVDTSAAMRFGTTGVDKAQLALGAAAAVGFLTSRNQNRVGAVVVAGDELRVVPPRSGRVQVQAILTVIATAPEIGGRAALGTAIERVAAMSRRRGFVAIISDFIGDTGWSDALARLGVRHDLLAIAVSDPREHDVPPIGLVRLVDPATGIEREVRVTAKTQERYRDVAARRYAERTDLLGRAGADVVELSTEDDWLGSIVGHVQRRRVQAVRGQALRR